MFPSYGDECAHVHLLLVEDADVVAADPGDVAIISAGVLASGDAGMVHVLELQLGAAWHRLVCLGADGVPFRTL